MDHLSFWVGLAVGFFATCAGAAGVVVWMIRMAPHLPDDPTVVHVTDGAPPPDPLPLPDRYAGETCACGHGRAVHRGSVGEGDRLTHCRIPDCLCEGWMNAERWDRLVRRSTTHYPPYSTHHDLMPTEWPDGTVTYHDTRLPDPGVDDG